MIKGKKLGRLYESPFNNLFYKYNYKLEGWNNIQLKLINNTDIADANANPQLLGIDSSVAEPFSSVIKALTVTLR